MQLAEVRCQRRVISAADRPLGFTADSADRQKHVLIVVAVRRRRRLRLSATRTSRGVAWSAGSLCVAGLGRCTGTGRSCGAGTGEAARCCSRWCRAARGSRGRRRRRPRGRGARPSRVATAPSIGPGEAWDSCSFRKRAGSILGTAVIAVSFFESVVRDHSKDPPVGRAHVAGTRSLRSVVHHSAGATHQGRSMSSK